MHEFQNNNPHGVRPSHEPAPMDSTRSLSPSHHRRLKAPSLLPPLVSSRSAQRTPIFLSFYSAILSPKLSSLSFSFLQIPAVNTLIFPSQN
ncbi:Uncharacterized protein TCM_023741 [Theobroma cacao]|uniref:Uncharacterized protein n=1 Tax=Theobroma cacao TaxID=3641 RepID=A0A061F2H7_THECC|nr:Uncharacterized protein TCM_023741 [Theobroma cacao]